MMIKMSVDLAELIRSRLENVRAELGEKENQTLESFEARIREAKKEGAATLLISPSQYPDYPDLLEHVVNQQDVYTALQGTEEGRNIYSWIADVSKTPPRSILTSVDANDWIHHHKDGVSQKKISFSEFAEKELRLAELLVRLAWVMKAQGKSIEARDLLHSAKTLFSFIQTFHYGEEHENMRIVDISLYYKKVRVLLINVAI